MKLNPVTFELPNLSLLSKNGNFCADMHCHTEYSDGDKLSNVIKAMKNKKISIAITDHNEVKGVVKASKFKDINIIPGIEINTIDGPHFLAYFYDVPQLEEFHNKYIEPSKFFNRQKFTHMVEITMIELMDILKKYDHVSCLPHPYSLAWANINNSIIRNPKNREVVHNVDAIEVISGMQMNKANQKAHALQILLDKGITAGSDAHRANEIGKCITFTKANSIEEFLDAIKKKKTMAMGKELMRHKAAAGIRMLKKDAKRIKTIMKNRLFLKNDPIP